MVTALTMLIVCQVAMWQNMPQQPGINPAWNMNPAWSMPKENDDRMLLMLLLQQCERQACQQPAPDHALLELLRDRRNNTGIDPSMLMMLMQQQRQQHVCPPQPPPIDPVILMMMMQQRQQQPLLPPSPIIMPQPQRHGLLGGLFGR